MKRIFKTQNKSGMIPALFRGWKEWEDGDFVEGIYDSHYMTEYNKQPQYNWRIKVVNCNFMCTDKEGNEVDPVGQLLVLNSAGQLNKHMLENDVAKGWGIYVEYGGKVASKDPKDKQLYHTFTNIESGPLDESHEDLGGL